MLSPASQKLADDHARLDDVLTDVKSALAAAEAASALAQLDFFWAGLAIHIRAEHLCLFPAVIRAAEIRANEATNVPSSDEINDSIAQLRADHDFFMKELSAAVGELREVAAKHSETELPMQRVGERIAHVERRLISHNAKEESEVYRWLSSLLAPDAHTELAEAVAGQLENLPPRFSG